MTPDAQTAPLLEWYERYIGEPDTETDVYLGFGLFFVGIALAVVGLALFLWSARLEAGSAFYWNLREVAIVLASLGLPSGMVGIVVLLPVDRRALYAADWRSVGSRWRSSSPSTRTTGTSSRPSITAPRGSDSTRSVSWSCSPRPARRSSLTNSHYSIRPSSGVESALIDA